MHIERETYYEVDLRQIEQHKEDLTITYNHTNPTNGQPCLQETSYTNAPTYQEIANQCYFNYLRVYTPPASELLNSSRHSISGEILISGVPWDSSAQASSEFVDFATFSNFFMVPRGESVTSTLNYSLPQTIVQTDDGQYRYQLWLQKQAGIGPETVTIVISLPKDSTLINSSPYSLLLSQDNKVQFTIELRSDTLISLSFN
jgi:hypothetical protein